MWDLSSPAKDRTCPLCIGRQSFSHWTTREIQGSIFWGKNIHIHVSGLVVQIMFFKAQTVLEEMTKLSAEEINQGWFKPMGLCPCYWPGKDTKSNLYNAFPAGPPPGIALISILCFFSLGGGFSKLTAFLKLLEARFLLWPFSQSDTLSWDLEAPRKVAPSF